MNKGALFNKAQVSYRQRIEIYLWGIEMENLLDNLGEGILVVNDEGTILYCNNALANEFKIKREEIETHKLQDCILYEDNIQLDLMKMIQRHHNEEFTAMLHLSTLENAQKYKIKTVTDDFKDTQAVYMILKKEEIYTKADLELLLDNVPYELWLKRSDGSYKYTNRKFREWIRKQNAQFVDGDIIQKTDREILGINSYKDIKEKEEYLEETGQSIIMESDNMADNKWYKTYYRLVMDKQKTGRYIVGCRRDCTVSKRLEKELEISTTKNLTMNTLLDVNKTEITTSSIIEYIGRSISKKLITQLDIEAIEIGIYDFKTETINYIHRKRNGHVQDIDSCKIDKVTFNDLLGDISTWGITKVSKVKNQFLYSRYMGSDAEYIGVYPIKYNNKLLGFIAFTYLENQFLQVQHHDFFIHLCKQIAQSVQILECTRRMQEQIKKRLEIEEEYKKAKELDTLRNEFFSNISHELRTPLNIMMAMLGLIDKYVQDNKIKWEEDTQLKERLLVIKQNSYRLTRLINNLIDITHIDAGLCKLNYKNVDVIAIIEEMILSVAKAVEEKGREIIFDTEEEELIMTCDVEKLEKVILNLISNAIK